MPAYVIENWFIGAELNVIELEIRTGTTPVGQGWMELVTRVTLSCHGVTLDSDVEPTVFDYVTSKASSILKIYPGRSATVIGDFTTTPDPDVALPARLDFYHGIDNAVLSHIANNGGLRLRVHAP